MRQNSPASFGTRRAGDPGLSPDSIPASPARLDTRSRVSHRPGVYPSWSSAATSLLVLGSVAAGLALVGIAVAHEAASWLGGAQ